MKKYVESILLDVVMQTTIKTIQLSLVDHYHEKLNQSIKLLLIKILKPKTRQHVYLKQSDLM